MKFNWRITKYNPILRDSNGFYLRDEWCIYAEVGKTFEGIKYDFKEYERVENLYIAAIELFMRCNNITALQIDTLEKNKNLTKDSHNNSHMIHLFNEAKEGDWIEMSNMQDFCKLIFREKLWCKLRYPRKMFVHFGWDFYMYVGSVIACEDAIDNIEKSGLFVELFKSPYE